MRYLLIKIVLMLSVSLRAQTFNEQLELVNKSFVNSSNLSFQVKYILKQNHSSSSKVISESSGRYHRKNERYISKYDDKTTLVTQTEIISIDEATRRIRVKKKKKDDADSQIDFLSQLIDFNKLIEKVVTVPTAERNHVVYDVWLKGKDFFPVSHYEITINKRTDYIEKLSFFYIKPLGKNDNYNIQGTEIPRLDIYFSDFNSSALNGSEQLSPGYYYQVNNNKLSPTPNFAGYDIKQIY